MKIKKVFKDMIYHEKKKYEFRCFNSGEPQSLSKLVERFQGLYFVDDKMFLLTYDDHFDNKEELFDYFKEINNGISTEETSYIKSHFKNKPIAVFKGKYIGTNVYPKILRVVDENEK